MKKILKLSFLFLISLSLNNKLFSKDKNNLKIKPIINQENINLNKNLFSKNFKIPGERGFSNIASPHFFDQVLKPTDFHDKAASNAAMKTISKHGRYFLSNDIRAFPRNNDVSCIRITSSNVLLDLNDSTIMQRPDSSATGFFAIEVSANLSNIVIRNGRINTITGYGIYVNSNCNNIILENLSISNITGDGVTLTSTSNSILNNIRINNCTTSSGDVHGLTAETLRSSTILDSSFDRNDATSGTAYGLKLDSAVDCKIENCTASFNGSNSNHSIGFSLENGFSCVLKGCTASSNTCDNNTGNVFGFQFDNGTYSKLIDSTAIYQNSNSNTVIIAGIYFASGEKYSSIENCQSFGNSSLTGTGGESYGIKFGLSTTGPTNCIIKNCLLYNNNGSSKSYGYKDFAPQSTTALGHNVSFGHGSTNPGAGNPNGGTDSGNMNYYFTYLQTPAHSSSKLIEEGTYTDIGDMGRLGDWDNLSIIS